MTLNIIHTPECSSNLIHAIMQILKSQKGPLDFVFHDIDFDIETFPFLSKYREDFVFPEHNEVEQMHKLKPNLNLPLSWRELFSLCNKSREIKNIADEDFIVLITKRRNALNWFSAFDNNNIFVHAGDWDLYIEHSEESAVAYQVLSNVLQNKMKLDLTKSPISNVHYNPRGCFADFCENKRDVILKLRTADICNDCVQLLYKNGVSDELLNQVVDTFETIRKNLLFKQGFKKANSLKSVLVDKDIHIGDVKLKLTPLMKTIYILFLRHQEGIVIKDLVDYRNEIIEIYTTFKGDPDLRKIDSLVNPVENKFHENKAKLHRVIKSAVPSSISALYLIEGERGGIFKINVPSFMVKYGPK
jgi:hypothetical protein